MAERFKAPVLKTDDGRPSASSNLAPTANGAPALGRVRWIQSRSPSAATIASARF